MLERAYTWRPYPFVWAPREPREDNAYIETGSGDWVPGPRDFEGEIDD